MPDEPANLKKVAGRSSSMDLQEGGQLASQFTEGLALPVHRLAGVPPPWRTHPALSVSFRQMLVLLSVTRTARRPSGLAGCVQRWHRQPEVLPQIDQMDTRSQRHSGMSHSCFVVSELGFIECQVHPSSTKNSF